MSEFLGIFCEFSIYTYHDNYIEHLYGNNHSSITGPNRVEWAYLDSDTVTEKLYWAMYGFGIDIYIYDQSFLRKIHHVSRQHDDGSDYIREYEFIYDAKNTLSCIRQIWPEGGTRMIYSTMRINYKAFGAKLLECAQQAVSAFLCEHDGEQFTRFAMYCFTGHSYVCLCMDTSTDDETEESPADWTYFDFANFPLIDFPLDDQQEENLMKSIVKVAKEFKETECFQTLTANTAFRIMVFNHEYLICEL
jgi:hypothetical protein